jgi:hypothetical protein
MSWMPSIRHTSPLVLPGLVMCLAFTTTGAPAAQQPSNAFPPRLEQYMTDVVKLTGDDRARLMAGQPFAVLLETGHPNELAVLGAVWITAARSRYAEAARDIETFERGGGFRVTRRVSSPPRLEDFQDLRLSDEDVADLRTCRVGNCELKLGEEALERVRSSVNWNSATPRAEVDAIVRQIALEYATGYLEGGNDRLAVYRDRSRPTFVATEFRSLIDAMPGLTAYLPEVRQYLLEYPRATLRGATSFLYWQEAEFGLKPIHRLTHFTVRDGLDESIVVSKMLYASHYFWTGVELRALIPDPSRGDGFWFVTNSRSRSDGLTGLTGFVLRGRVESEVLKGALGGLEWTKRWLEGERR